MDPQGNDVACCTVGYNCLKWSQKYVSHLWILHVVQLVITVETNHKSMPSRKKYGLLIEIRKIIRFENINIHVLVYVTG